MMRQSTTILRASCDVYTISVRYTRGKSGGRDPRRRMHTYTHINIQAEREMIDAGILAQTRQGHPSLQRRNAKVSP